MKFCKKCQSDTERNSYGQCKPCATTRVVAWQKANPDKLKTIKAKYYVVNRSKAKASVAAWTRANPEANRIKSHNYLSRLKASGGKLSKGLSAKLFNLQRGLCPCCKQPLENDYHLDHKMPLALGGANEDWNMQLLRATCNIKKSAKHPNDFMRERGFLL